MYLVIFCYWVGPVPYLELFGAGPVEKNTLYFGYVKIDNSNTHYHCFTRIPVEQVSLPVLVVIQFHRSAHCRLDSAGVKKRKRDLALGQDDAFYGEGHLSLTLPVQLTVN